MSGLQQQARDRSPAAWTALPRILWPLALAVAVGAIFYFLIGASVSDYASKIMLIAGINIILAVSLNVVNGFTGQFSMGHAGFMAVGGYVAATITYYGSIKLFGSAAPAGGLLSMAGGADSQQVLPLLTRGDALFLVACLAGGLASAAAGYVVGLPSLRLRGDYLAIVTLGFGEIVRVLLQGTPDQIQPWKAAEAQNRGFHELAIMLGGPKGFNLLPTYTTLFWVWFFVVLTLIVCYRLKISSSGRAFLSIREDEIASQAMGVDITRYKVRAFVLASFFAGLGGSLYAMDVGSINATDLGFQKSFDFIIMVVLGGLGSISGAAVAAVILTVLPELLRDLPPVWPAGLLLLAVMAATQWKRRHWHVKSLVAVALGTIAFEAIRQVCKAQGINLADFRLIIYALMLIVMMLARPQGLFGVREVWEFFRRRTPTASPPATPNQTPEPGKNA